MVIFRREPNESLAVQANPVEAAQSSPPPNPATQYLCKQLLRAAYDLFAAG